MKVGMLGQFLDHLEMLFGYNHASLLVRMNKIPLVAVTDLKSTHSFFFNPIP